MNLPPSFYQWLAPRAVRAFVSPAWLWAGALFINNRMTVPIGLLGIYDVSRGVRKTDVRFLRLWTSVNPLLLRDVVVSEAGCCLDCLHRVRSCIVRNESTPVNTEDTFQCIQCLFRNRYVVISAHTCTLADISTEQCKMWDRTCS